TKASTSLLMNGSNVINFSVDNSAGSYAANRFRIVFSQAKALPLTLTNVKAYRQNTGIQVEWDVENETGIRQYEIEKSTDGNSYSKVNVTKAKNAPVSSYAWVDEDGQAGYNYYRIKSIDINGKIEYSKVVKVFIPLLKQSITVFPNPVKEGIINLQMVNQSSGIYVAKLLNALGETVLTTTFLHQEDVTVEKIHFNEKMPGGIYMFQISNAMGKATTVKVKY
ncbi:MAG: T9SS type A sorting domain-containing protein, partial [Bacteroidota bacterium]|nr:T9SS type A sorting domain-containing protein [Bacteroidota bacterium]